MTDLFDSSTQEKFKKYVTDVKRPAVGQYLRGESENKLEKHKNWQESLHLLVWHILRQEDKERI